MQNKLREKQIIQASNNSPLAHVQVMVRAASKCWHAGLLGDNLPKTCACFFSFGSGVCVCVCGLQNRLMLLIRDPSLQHKFVVLKATNTLASGKVLPLAQRVSYLKSHTSAKDKLLAMGTISAGRGHGQIELRKLKQGLTFSYLDLYLFFTTIIFSLF